MEKIKAHPLMFFRFIYPFLFVALIPMARRVIWAITDRHYVGMVAAEIFLVFAAVGISVIRCFCCKIVVYPDKIRFYKGFLHRTETTVSKNRVSAVTYSVNPVFLLFSAVNVRLETETAGELSLIIPKKDVTRINSFLKREEPEIKFTIGAKRVLLFSAATSSAAVGLLLTAPVVGRAGKLLNTSLTEKLLGAISQTAEGLGGLISPAAGAISLILIALYFVAFIVTLFKNIFMAVGVGENGISINAGLLPRRFSYIKRAAVNNVIIERAPLLWAFGRSQLRLSVAGYSRLGGDTAVLLPATKNGEAERLFYALCGVNERKSGVFAEKGTRFRFIRWRLILLVLVFPCAFLACMSLPFLTDFIIFVASALAAVVLYLLGLAIYNHKNGSITFYSDGVHTHSVKTFSVREVFFRRSRVGAFNIRRFPADRKQGTCTLTVYSRSREGESARVKFIDYETIYEYCRSFWEN